jgi:hypothetical protein
MVRRKGSTRRALGPLSSITSTTTDESSPIATAYCPDAEPSAVLPQTTPCVPEISQSKPAHPEGPSEEPSTAALAIPIPPTSGTTEAVPTKTGSTSDAGHSATAPKSKDTSAFEVPPDSQAEGTANTDTSSETENLSASDPKGRSGSGQRHYQNIPSQTNRAQSFGKFVRGTCAILIGVIIVALVYGTAPYILQRDAKAEAYLSDQIAKSIDVFKHTYVGQTIVPPSAEKAFSYDATWAVVFSKSTTISGSCDNTDFKPNQPCVIKTVFNSDDDTVIDLVWERVFLAIGAIIMLAAMIFYAENLLEATKPTG